MRSRQPLDDTWRDIILGDFVPNISKLILIADPDNMLSDEKLLSILQEYGFDLIDFTDFVEFRYIYELKYRSAWDQGKGSDRVVALRFQNLDFESVPYDLLQAGWKLSFNLGELFPHLSYAIIQKLDRHFLDILFEIQPRYQPNHASDNSTKDFILRNAFHISTESIFDEVELLRILLRLHHRKFPIPPILADHLIEELKGRNRFKAWPLSIIISDREAFFAFLQERWPIFLTKLHNADEVREGSTGFNLKYSGPVHLPLDHEDIKIYISNLFLEGKLSPVEVDSTRMDKVSWIQSGTITIDKDNNELKISYLFEVVEREFPTLRSNHHDWTAFALRWAELSSMVYCGNILQHRVRLNRIRDGVNRHFVNWLSKRYGNLISLSPASPVMLHHIPRRLAQEIGKGKNSKVALIVVDGLALDQWITIRQLLQEQDTNLIIRESAVFAWIPTLTSVSRQSIFSGKQPLYFSSSIKSTNNEERLWKRFWEEQGIHQSDIIYRRNLGDQDILGVLDDAIHPDKTRVVGLIINKVDKIMHGMQLGTAGMHNQVKQWCQGGILATVIGQLLNYGYTVWLTSDHGNIECNGKGMPSEGAIAEIRGERVRVYPTPELRSRFANSFSFAYEWKPIGLPPDYFPLIAGGQDAFANPSGTIVGHGGASIEEVIVPFVRFERGVRP